MMKEGRDQREYIYAAQKGKLRIKNFHKNGDSVRSSKTRVEYMLEGRLHHSEFYSHQ